MPPSDDGVANHLNDQKDQLVHTLVDVSEGLRQVAGLAERLSVVLDKLDFTQSAEAQAKQYLDLLAASKPLTHIKPDLSHVTPGVTGKRRRQKDPNAPKRPPTAYLLYQNAMRAKTREENPEMGVQAIMSHIATTWGTLSEKDKKPYLEAQERARAQYAKDFAAWTDKAEKNGEVEPQLVVKSSKAAKEKEKEQPKASATKAKVVVPSPPKAAIPSPPKAAVSTLPKPQLDEIATDSDEGSSDDSSEESEEEEESSEEAEPEPPKKKAKTTLPKSVGKTEKSSKKK